jgi:hypothetical protein
LSGVPRLVEVRLTSNEGVAAIVAVHANGKVSLNRGPANGLNCWLELVFDNGQGSFIPVSDSQFVGVDKVAVIGPKWAIEVRIDEAGKVTMRKHRSIGNYPDHRIVYSLRGASDVQFRLSEAAILEGSTVH